MVVGLLTSVAERRARWGSKRLPVMLVLGTAICIVFAAALAVRLVDDIASAGELVRRFLN